MKIYYELVKVTIIALSFAKNIINVVIWDYSLPNLLINNWVLVFISKFYSSFCYFLRIEQKLSTAFQPQINGKTDKQNNTIKPYLQVFLNFEQNVKAKLLLINKLAYNNIKNTNNGHSLFKLNFSYNLKIF